MRTLVSELNELIRHGVGEYSFTILNSCLVSGIVSQPVTSLIDYLFTD